MKALNALIGEFRTGQGLKGQLLRGGFWSLAIKLLSTVMALVLAIVLARLLGPEEFGIYSFVFALVTIMAIPAQMGLPNLVVRETAKAQVLGRYDLMKGLWRWSSLVALATSVGLMGVGAITAWAVADAFGQVQAETLVWGLVLIPLVALGHLRGAALRGLRKVVQGQLPEFVLRPFFFATFVLVAWGVLGANLGPAEAMMLHGIAALAAFAIGAWLLYRERPAQLVAQKQWTTQGRLWLASAVPLGMVEGINIINQNIGILMLGTLATDEDVGIFRVALQGAVLVSFGFTAANAMIGPHIARLHARGDRSSIQRIVVSVANAVFLLALPITLVIVFWGPAFISLLFGAQFGEAYTPLVILTLAQLGNAATGCVGALLTMTGHEKTVAASMIIAAVVTTIATIVLVPIWGPLGAAVANSLGVITWNIFLFIRAASLLNVYSIVGANFMKDRLTENVRDGSVE